MRKLNYVLIVLGMVSFPILSPSVYGEVEGTDPAPDEARVLEVIGDVQYQKAGTGDWRPLTQNATLAEGDAIKTGKDSQAKLLMGGANSAAEVVLKKESQFSFKDLKHDPNKKADTTLLDLEMGSILVNAAKLPKESKFQVKTPTSMVGIRGTKFEVTVERASSSKTS
ncbi:MAG: FecR domain-containing protein [Candidatus Omnitrophica bacterium]|nr:FecR domain-containing protein [Candidatus Omnitrophota bacterium]